MRSTKLSSLFILATLAGCGESIMLDAGVDAGTSADAGPRDAGPRDAGPRDAGPRDAGPIEPEDAGFDAGPPFDAGSIGGCVAAPVTIQDSCPDFTACGGTPSGSWCYSGICIETADFLGPAVEALALCPNLVLDLGGTVVGRLEFTGGTNVTREATTHIEGTASIPGLCLTIAGRTCADVEAAIDGQLAPNGSATCSVGAGNVCNCSAVWDLLVNDAATYTVTDSTLTVGARTYDFCAQETSFEFVDTTTDGAEPGIQSTVPEL
jgi:hypothetical protein